MNISHGHELNERGSAGQHARIRELNDRLRTAGTGGKVVVTNGIAALEPATADRVLEAVRQFDAFGPDNDPWSEHDCASLTADGVKVIWKIDYFERSGRIHSPDPADPKVTLRVLTIMLADEY
nr:DUF3768 domain-containing protein [Methylopila sp. M107]